MPIARIYVDLGGNDLIPHVAISLANGVPSQYYGPAIGIIECI
jgi:hypothetical protein